MKIERDSSIPLVVHDPYLSIWSGADHLYDADPVHWSGLRQQLRGTVTVDGTALCFLGHREGLPFIEQTGVDLTATATEYTFENGKLALSVRFVSPLLPQDLTLVSRPCTYVDFQVRRKVPCSVSIDFAASEDLVSEKRGEPLAGGSFVRQARDGAPAFAYAFMGKAYQKPMGSSGDNLTIDWGYAYLASEDGCARLSFDRGNGKIHCGIDFGQQKEKGGLVVAYDDLLSINYFGQWRKAYWTTVYPDILAAIGASFAEKDAVLARARETDGDVHARAVEAGGEDYALLCDMTFRLATAAHKLIADEAGNVIFLSKENDSNGCVGTVDLSYPSCPLYLLYNPELVKGMLRPVFDFASMPVWTYDFSPHDVGRYPYAWGQVYGMDRNGQMASVDGKGKGIVFEGNDGAVYPPFYLLPGDSGLYDLHYQMPVEESGNMLILTAAVCLREGSAQFAAPYMETLGKWCGYLLQVGADPGEQLCTDDFAGHLSHNVNLSVKAILGIEAYAQLLEMQGSASRAAGYHARAKEMAESLEERAFAGDHYTLAFGQSESWSMKYNAVWDLIFGSGLFSGKFFQTETAYYLKKQNRYGTPLDSRKDWTKSDWLLWCAAMAQDPGQASRMIAPVARYLEETPSRFPFSDWYDTGTGAYCHFKGRSVQGGVFMPILLRSWK